MTPCRKRVLGIFGFILFLVLIFVPCRDKRVNSFQERGSVLVRRIITERRSFMPLPRYLKLRGRTVSEKTGEERRVALNAGLYGGEIGAVIVLGLFDFFLICGLKKRKRS